MPRNYSAVIADASCFILLDKIESLPLLQSLFKTISTSIEVAEEFGKPLPEWVEIKTVRDKNFQSALFLQVDAGEASAIALAAENQPSLLIIDDLKGRRLPQIKPLFERIQATNFRIAPSLLKSILEQAGE